MHKNIFLEESHALLQYIRYQNARQLKNHSTVRYSNNLNIHDLTSLAEIDVRKAFTYAFFILQQRSTSSTFLLVMTVQRLKIIIHTLLSTKANKESLFFMEVAANI